MKNLLRSFCVAVFLVGLLVFSQAQVNKNNDNVIEPALPYVVESIQYFANSDGSVKITGRSTRYVKANGEWRLELYGPKGKDTSSKDSREPPVYAGGPDGVYAKGIGSDSRRPVSPSADQKMLEFFRSHNSLRSHREFVRTDGVAGLQVYVLHAETNNPDSPQVWIEKSYSPKTGHNPLRMVVHFRDGSEIRIEAVNIEFKEVPEDLNNDLKSLPIKEKEDKKP